MSDCRKDRRMVCVEEEVTRGGVDAQTRLESDMSCPNCRSPPWSTCWDRCPLGDPWYGPCSKKGQVTWLPQQSTEAGTSLVALLMALLSTTSQTHPSTCWLQEQQNAGWCLVDWFVGDHAMAEHEWCARIAQFPQHASMVLNSSYPLAGHAVC